MCEGTSEIVYFQGIRGSLRLPKERVQIPVPPGNDPRTLVDYAISERSSQRRDRAWSAGDTAWVVFDGEEHRQRDPHNWNDATQRANARSIQLAISNPCVELWFLLHFQDQTAYLTRDQAWAALRKHLAHYDKGSRLYPNPLAHLTHEAMGRARQLHTRAERNGLEPHPNPSTGIFRLVDTILELERST